MAGMAAVPVTVLLIPIFFLMIYLFVVTKGRMRSVTLSLVILVAIAITGSFCYMFNSTFQIEFKAYVLPSSKYVDRETNTLLPLPPHSAYLFQSSPREYNYFTNKTPQEIEEFYRSLKGATIYAEPSSEWAGWDFYNIIYKGKNVTVAITPEDKLSGSRIFVSSCGVRC